MVLVSYIPSISVSLLQTQCSDREGHKARRGGWHTVPLAPDSAGGHSAGEARLTRGPAPMPHLLHMADPRQPGEPRLHQQTSLPRAARPELEMARLALGGRAGGITQDHPLCFPLPPQPLHGGIRAMRGGTRPPQPPPPTDARGRHRVPPTSQRGCARPWRPLCWGLRPARLGWSHSLPSGAMTPRPVGAAKQSCVQS
jgi:hypothetical protein